LNAVPDRALHLCTDAAIVDPEARAIRQAVVTAHRPMAWTRVMPCAVIDLAAVEAVVLHAAGVVAHLRLVCDVP